MKHNTEIPVVKIILEDGRICLINECDFDKKKHKLASEAKKTPKGTKPDKSGDDPEAGDTPKEASTVYTKQDLAKMTFGQIKDLPLFAKLSKSDAADKKTAAKGIINLQEGQAS